VWLGFGGVASAIKRHSRFVSFVLPSHGPFAPSLPKDRAPPPDTWFVRDEGASSSQWTTTAVDPALPFYFPTIVCSTELRSFEPVSHRMLWPQRLVWPGPHVLRVCFPMVSPFNWQFLTLLQSTCRVGNCTANCDQKSECDPGWGSEWSSATKCPLNVCCSEYGY
jgi:hypothetical protein